MSNPMFDQQRETMAVFLATAGKMPRRHRAEFWAVLHPSRHGATKHARGQQTPSGERNHPKSLDRIGMPALPWSGPPKPPAPIIKQSKFWRRRGRVAPTPCKFLDQAVHKFHFRNEIL